MAPSLYAVRASNFGRPRDGHERGSPGFPSTPCLNDSCRNDESIEWTRYWVRSLRIWSIRISDDREHRPTMTGQLAVPVMLEKRESRLTLLAVSPVPPWPPLDGMALRVSRLLQELSAHWSIVLICPRGGESAAENGITLSAEINVVRYGEWMYLPSQYDVRPFVKTVGETIRAHRPSVALFWGGMEYLRGAIPEMPISVSDRVDCMTLTAWRALVHARGYTELRRQVSHFAHVVRYEFQMRHAVSQSLSPRAPIEPECHEPSVGWIRGCWAARRRQELRPLRHHPIWRAFGV